MSYFDRRPHTFRILYAVLTLYVAVLFVYGVLVRQTRATDDNVWENAASDVMITQDGFGKPGVLNVVQQGDLVVRVQNVRVWTKQEVDSIIHRVAVTDSIHFVVRSLLQDKNYNVVIAKKQWQDSMTAAIPHGVRIGSVERNGASERAGLKVGDIIYRINGEEVVNSRQAQDLLMSHQAGTSIQYDIARQGKLSSVWLTASSVGIQFTVIVYYIHGILMILMGGGYVFARSYLLPARALSMFFLCFGTISLLSKTPPVYDYYGFINMATWVMASFLSTGFSMYAPLCMTDERTETKGLWLIFPLVIAVALVFIVFIASGNNISGYIFSAILGIWFVTVIAKRIVHKRVYATREAVYLMSAILTVAIISTFEVPLARLVQHVVRLLISKSGNNVWSTDTETFDVIFNYIRLVIISSIPFGFFSIMFRYQIFHLALRVRRNVQYMVTSFVWHTAMLLCIVAGLYCLALMHLVIPTIQIQQGIVEVVYDPNGAMTWGDTFAVSVLAIGWALGIRGIRRKGARIIDAKFDRQKYDYRRATDELADTLSANITTESIAGAIVNTIVQHMLLQRVGVLLYRDNQQLPCVTDSAGLSEEQHTTMTKKIDERFHSAIAKYTGDSRLSVVSLPADIARELSALGFRYVMPIRTNKWMSGILLIGEKKSEASFNREDFSFMSAFVRQCTIALDNALLYEQLTEQQRLEHELTIARDIQIMSLPQHTPNIKGLDIAGASIPAMEVGGDFYDYLVYEEHEMMVVVGDVSGKGTSAALYMSKVQGIMRTLRDFHLSPRDLFNRMNQLIYEELHKRSFITALSGLFHTQLNAMVLARAGHLPMYHYRAETFDVKEHKPKGVGLGITSQKHFSPHLELQRIDYKVGDVFVFVTDGITEARNEAQEEFGEEALIHTILLHAQNSANDIRDAILESTVIFRGTEKQFDDMTVVVIKINE